MSLISSLPMHTQQGEAQHIFSLIYAAVDDCLPQMCQLHRASTLPPTDQQAMVCNELLV